MSLKQLWYSKNELLSKNCFFNLTCGQRGCGKTFSFKEWCIADFIQNKKQFVWIRRYESELKGNNKVESVYNNFLKDLYKSERLQKLNFNENDFIIKKGVLYYQEKIKEGYTTDKGKEIAPKYKDIQVGQFIALSKADKRKSVVFSEDINKIIYDEFIIRENLTTRYLKDEVEILLDLVSTIQRERNNARVFLIGNAYSRFNPYFEYFGVKLTNDRFYIDKDRGLAVEQYKNNNFAKFMYDTNIGKLVKGTEYGDFSIENKYRNESGIFIQEIDTNNATYLATLKYSNNYYGFYYDYDNNQGYISNKWIKGSRIYALTPYSHTIGTILISKSRNHYIVKMLRDLYALGLLYFADEKCKYIIGGVLDLL